MSTVHSRVDASLRGQECAIASDAEMDAFISAWAVAGPELETMRNERLRCESVIDALAQLSDTVETANFIEPPRVSSGLVEMQRVFAQLRATMGTHPDPCVSANDEGA